MGYIICGCFSLILYQNLIMKMLLIRNGLFIISFLTSILIYNNNYHKFKEDVNNSLL